MMQPKPPLNQMRMTLPSEPHVPIRTCVGCGARRPQTELVRCVIADGAIHRSRVAPGRGAWLCGIGCVELARGRRGFERAWHVQVSNETIDRLVAELNE